MDFDLVIQSKFNKNKNNNSYQYIHNIKIPDNIPENQIAELYISYIDNIYINYNINKSIIICPNNKTHFSQLIKLLDLNYYPFCTTKNISNFLNHNSRILLLTESEYNNFIQSNFPFDNINTLIKEINDNVNKIIYIK
jgi:hypothetical protein